MSLHYTEQCLPFVAEIPSGRPYALQCNCSSQAQLDTSQNSPRHWDHINTAWHITNCGRNIITNFHYNTYHTHICIHPVCKYSYLPETSLFTGPFLGKWNNFASPTWTSSFYIHRTIARLNINFCAAQELDGGSKISFKQLCTHMLTRHMHKQP